VVNHNGYILSQERDLLIDGSLLLKNLKDPAGHPILRDYLAIYCQEYLSGISTVVSSAGASSYFHWLTESLPRIGLIKEFGLDLSQISYYLIPKNSLPAIPQSLKALGIDLSLCKTLSFKSCIQTENLFLASPPGKCGNPTPWVREFLRTSFMLAVVQFSNDFPKRFFISRRGNRRVLNENDLLPILKQYEISVVQPEKLSFLEQVALFSRAELVVAPHGAALANLMFCNARTSVLELFSPRYINVCFWAISNLGDLRYSYLEGEGERPKKGYDPHSIREDMVVSPSKLRFWLNSWL
jgi:capsular polysaccharide biosynthesis protein